MYLVYSFANKNSLINLTKNCKYFYSKWHLMSGIFLERVPLISQETKIVEREFLATLNKLENEKSLLSDHTLRYLEDIKKLEKKNKEDFVEIESESSMQTALEMEDLWLEEKKTFESTYKLTGCKSVNENLNRKLILVVKQMLGGDYRWTLPFGLRKDGENMKETSQRILNSISGPNLKATFLGNQPCGFTKFKYPPNTFKDIMGAKIFYFKAQCAFNSQSENILIRDSSIDKKQRDETGGPIISDVRWVSTEEMTFLLPKRQFKNIKKFLFELI